MPLMLEVAGMHAASMGADVRRRLGDSELKIGRDQDNDWILPQSYVSRHQAVVRCVNGMYFLEQIGSCPIVLNDSPRPLERNRIVRLSAGDRILIDDIEINVVESEAVPPSAPGRDFTAGYPSMIDSPPPEMPVPRDGPVDPLELLGGGKKPESRSAPPRMPPSMSALDEAMPPSVPANQGSSAPELSDNWFTRTSIQRGAPAAPPPSRPAQPRQAAQPPHTSDSIQAAPPPRNRTVALPGGPASGTLENLLRGAGLDPAHTQLSPEVAAQLGEVLRIVVDGTMQVLKARNQIRKEFRMTSTQVAEKNNNPLKFSADVADALHKLLVQRSPAYLDTVHSFTDAFDDIRVHQLAMLASLRVAFDHMLHQFDPEVLQAQVARPGGRGSVLGIGNKPKPWEAYVARFSELAADRDYAFRKLFGEEFGKAYENNLEKQKRMLDAAKNAK